MRPWRLTRRQRVEMEAALMALRSEGVRMERDIYPCTSTVEALRVAGVSLGLGVHDHDESILRARVALALRAALRADEDARCEDAFTRLAAESSPEAQRWQRDVSYCVGEFWREWPALRRGERVPRALWEVAR